MWEGETTRVGFKVDQSSITLYFPLKLTANYFGTNFYFHVLNLCVENTLEFISENVVGR